MNKLTVLWDIKNVFPNQPCHPCTLFDETHTFLHPFLKREKTPQSHSIINSGSLVSISFCICLLSLHYDPLPKSDNKFSLIMPQLIIDYCLNIIFDACSNQIEAKLRMLIASLASLKVPHDCGILAFVFWYLCITMKVNLNLPKSQLS